MTKLYANRVLVTDKGHYAFRPALIEVHGSQIARVEVEPQHIDSDAIRFNDKIIIPAFVNAHTHLPMSAFRGLSSVVQQEGNVVEDVYFQLESQLSDEDIRAFTRIGAYESLLQGVGFVWEHYYGGTALADGIHDAGLEGVVAPTLQDVHGPGTAILQAQLKATEALRSATTHLRESLRRLDHMQPTRSAIRSGGILSAWLSRQDFPCTFIWPNLGKSMSETKTSTVNLRSSASIP